MSSTPSVESIQRRYVVTIFSQLIQMILSVVTAGFVPRALGPTAYGNLTFLLSMSTSLRSATDLSSEQAFFTFSSSSTASGALTQLYGLWLIARFVGSALLVCLCFAVGWESVLLPGQSFFPAIAILCVDWLSYFALSLRQLADSKGFTSAIQLRTATMSLVTTAVLTILVLMGWLRFDRYVFLLLFNAFCSCVLFGGYLYRHHAVFVWEGRLAESFRADIQRWWTYGSPLIVYSGAMVLLNLADTYIIQKFYGSKEQAYFGLANRWSSAVLIFTSAALNVHWREIAHSYAAQNLKRTAEIYQRFDQLLFSLSLGLSMWLCFQSRFLLHTFAGDAYLPALVPLMIMAFYPVQQAYGQLNTAAFLATSRTQQYKNLGLWAILPSLLSTYFLLAPRGFPFYGFGLGAFGLAIKMVLVGFLVIQVYAYLNCRFFEISFLESVYAKLKVFVVCFVLGVIAYGAGFYGARILMISSDWVIAGVQTALYFLSTVLVFLRFPHWVGLETHHVAYLQTRMKNMLQRIAGLFK